MSKRFIIAFISFVGSIAPFALQALPPTSPFIRRDFDVSISLAQWSVTAFSLSLAVSLLIYGPLADRFDRKYLLFFGLGLFSLGTAIAALAPNIHILIFARVLQAAGAAAGTVVARALAANMFSREELAQIYGYMNMCIVVLPMFAPLLMGVMIDSYGWRAAMWLFCGFGLLILALLPPVLNRAGLLHMRPQFAIASRPGALATMKGLLSIPRFSIYLSISAAAQMGIFAFLAGAPFIFMEILGRPASLYGLFFIPLTASYFIGSWSSTRFSSSVGLNRMILFGYGTYVAGVVALLAMYVLDAVSVYPLFGFACLCTAANGAIQPNTSAGAMAAAGDAHAGSAASLTSFALVISGAAGLQLVGWVQGETALPMLLIMSGAGVIGALLIAALFSQSAESPAADNSR